MNSTFNIYSMIPFKIKNILKYGYSLMPMQARLGKEFFKQLGSLEKSQWWPEQKLKNYQNEELRKLVQHAYSNVPYYNSLFKANKLTPEDIKTIYDLPKLPVLTKDMVRNNFNLLQARSFKDNQRIKLSTSGTTGKPLSFYYDKSKEYLNYDPFIWRFFGWAGHKIENLHATLSCWTTQDKFYAYNAARNLLILSAYKMNINNVNEYAEIMEKYKVRYLDGYAGMFGLFTLFLKEKGIKPPVKLEAFFSHSESLCGWQRNLIENFWGCKCFDWYGMEERVILGVECDRHQGLHLCFDFGITELIDSEINGIKKIIATSLTNYAMPFLRYDTEDFGELNENKCGCGRGFPLLTLKGGRRKSFAIGKDKSYIPITNVDIPNVTDNVRQFQFIQEKQGALLLSIVKKNTFKDNDLHKIKAKLFEKFNNNMAINIQFVDSIQQTDNGKIPIFIQQMKEARKI